jgi:TusA-related sulfurtransferase
MICRHHGPAAKGVWACPTCLIELREENQRMRGERLVMLEILADAAQAIHNLPDEVETQEEADMLRTLKDRIADARGAVLLDMYPAKQES